MACSLIGILYVIWRRRLTQVADRILLWVDDDESLFLLPMRCLVDQVILIGVLEGFTRGFHNLYQCVRSR